MPKASIASALVETAAKWFAGDLSPSAPTIHARAALAFACVSSVVNVFEHTITNVSAGSMLRLRSSSWVRSTFDTKCGVMPPLHSALSASHTSSGPKSDPPMPMFTTCLNGLPVIPSFLPERTAAAKSTSFLRDSRTSACTAAGPAKSERSAVCNTARCSVLLIGSPRNIAALRPGRSAARAKSNNSGKVLPVMRWREISSSQESCSTWQFCQRCGSAAVKSRKCAPANSSACAATAPHSLKLEFNCVMAGNELSRSRVVKRKIPFDELLHTRFQIGARPIAHVARQRFDIGPGVGQIAGLHRQQILLRAPPQALFEHLDVAQQRHRLLIADVVNSIRGRARGRIRRRGIPVGIGRRHSIYGADDALDDVVDIGEIPLMLAAVEHVDGQSCQD